MIKKIIFFSIVILINRSAIGQQTIENTSDNLIATSSDKMLPWKFESDVNSNTSKKLDSIITYTQDEKSGEWNQKTSKRTFFYDSNMNDTLVVHSGWDTTTNKWEFRAKITRKYNEQSNTLTQESYVMNRAKYRTEYIFNNESYLIQTVESRWSFNNNDWFYLDKTLYSYDSDGFLQSDSLYYRYNFSGSKKWRLVGKTDYSYNADNKLSADTTYIQNWVDKNASSGWRFYNNKKYTYSTENLIEECILSNWNRDSVKFMPYEREIKRYFDDGQTIKTRIKFNWDTRNSKWEADELKENILENNFITKCQTQKFDESPTHYSQNFTFDFNVPGDNIVLPTIGLDANEKAVFHHQIECKYYLQGSTEITEWEKYLKSEYFYSDITTLATEKLEAPTEVKIYPNPASDFINVNYPDSFNEALFILFDINGETILTQRVNTNKKINISLLNNGFYIYKLTQGQEIITGKLIKR